MTECPAVSIALYYSPGDPVEKTLQKLYQRITRPVEIVIFSLDVHREELKDVGDFTCLSLNNGHHTAHQAFLKNASGQYFAIMFLPMAFLDNAIEQFIADSHSTALVYPLSQPNSFVLCHSDHKETLLSITGSSEKALNSDNPWCSAAHHQGIDVGIEHLQARSIVSNNSAHPLVSCIMPTANRPEFIQQAIDYFQRQTYPHKELIIVYDQLSDLPNNLAINTETIRCILSEAHSIGEKRNQAVAAAHGEYIAHWDDDDWYGRERLQKQLEPLLSQNADITALTQTLFLSLSTLQAQRASNRRYQDLFVNNVHGGTLVYRRSIWLHDARYPATSLREDADFMCEAMEQGSRLSSIHAPDIYLYVRHDHNSWQLEQGDHQDVDAQWHTAALPLEFDNDKAFYHAGLNNTPTHSSNQLEPIATHNTVTNSSTLAKVSCVMPTANRYAFIPFAIKDFIAQDYPNKELIIIDDGSTSIQSLIPEHPDFVYHRLASHYSLGEKRNIACEMANGEYIVHWDDDDWHSPQWISRQIAFHQTSGADISGLDQLFFYESNTDDVWLYRYGQQDTPWLAGGTLCYRRSLWEQQPFGDLHVGEDNDFIWRNHSLSLKAGDHQQDYVALIHPNNTDKKSLLGPWWTQSSHNIKTLMGHETERYQSPFLKPSLKTNERYHEEAQHVSG